MILGAKMLQQWFDNVRGLADLKAQLDMAEYAFVMIWLTFISCGIAAGGLWGLLRSLKLTRQALELSRDAAADARHLGEANSRAYLHVAKMEFSDDGRAAILTIENTGSTPAPMLCAGCEVKKIAEWQMQDALRSHSTYAYKGWHGLPADTSRDFRVDFTSGAELIIENIEAMAPYVDLPERQELPNKAWSTKHIPNVVIVGRVVWKDVFGQHLETYFAFFTKDVANSRLKIPHGILPAFRIIGEADIPKGLELTAASIAPQ